MRLFIILWCLTFSSFASIIGDVILHEGNAVIERTDGEDVESELDLDIFSYDTIKTGKGKVAVGFIDDCDGACLGKENWTAFWICLGLGLTSLLGALGLKLKEDN